MIGESDDRAEYKYCVVIAGNCIDLDICSRRKKTMEVT